MAAPCDELLLLEPLLRAARRPRNPPPLLHTLVIAHSSKNIRRAFCSNFHAANTGSPTMRQKSAITSGHHANTPGLFSLTRCTYVAQHEKRLAAIHGTFGRHATHIPMTTNNLMASSTFIPPGIGHCSVCLCESRRRDRVSSGGNVSNLHTRDIFHASSFVGGGVRGLEGAPRKIPSSGES